MWVRLKVVKQIDVRGTPTKKYPGDWVDIGKQQALLWLSVGDAEIPDMVSHNFDFSECAAHIVENFQKAQSRIVPIYENLKVIDNPIYEYQQRNKAMYWNPKAFLRVELLPIGFSFLDKWDIACPLYNYDALALGEGTPEEQERTKDVIHDLRVLMYDTRLIFARKCDETKEVFKLWRDDVNNGDNDRLAFLRAMYKVKPLMLALPSTWTDKDAPR